LKDDKKKMVVLGALGAVLLGVGAFSFLGGGSPAPKPTPGVVAKKDGDADGSKEVKVDADGNPIPGTGEEAEPAPNPLYVAELPQRDPFVSRELPGEKLQAPVSLPPPSQPVKRPSGGSGRRYAPPSNFDSSGGFAPAQLSGPLPNANGGTVTLNPTGPDPSMPGYSLSGTLNGARKIAVFTDSNGNQRMVPEGGSLDGDSKVVSIEKGSVTIESRGKKQRLSLGGNPK
jgi:hypothetical protein